MALTEKELEEQRAQTADLARQNAFYRDHGREDATPDEDDL